MAVSLSIFPLTPPSLFLVFFLYLSPNPVSFFLTHYRPCLSFNLVLSPTLISFSLFHRVYLSRTLSICSSLSLPQSTLSAILLFLCLSYLCLSFSFSLCGSLFLLTWLSFYLTLSLSSSLSLFLSFSLLKCHTFYLFFYMWLTLSFSHPRTQSLYLSLTLSPTLSLFVSFSLSHPTSTFFSLSVALLLSPNMFLFLFFLSVYLALSHSQPFLCFNLSLSPTPISLSLSPTLFLSLSHPCLFLYLPPCFFSTLSLILSFSLPHCLSFYLATSPTLSLSLPPCLFIFVFLWGSLTKRGKDRDRVGESSFSYMNKTSYKVNKIFI